MKQEYYLGLDMGTGSVGWAVTDTDYQVLKSHGKALWGVRLFETAMTAEERRGFRTARRRLDRRNWRIQILQEIFSEEIAKVDPGFFLRMKESKYYPEDKLDEEGNCPKLPYALFVDKKYTDKDYHKEFPTIYHLRKMLMETKNTPDIRLVYLAIHHILKHRGHFLLSGNISQIKDFSSTFTQLLQNIMAEELDWELELEEKDIEYIGDTLKNRTLTRSAKKTRLVKQLKARSSCEKAMLNLIVGGTAKLSDIFGNKDLDECEKPKISFADSTYDDYIGVVEADLGEQFYIIASAKAVYDWSVLVEILGNSVSISEAKVKSYEKHKSDLKKLKKIVRQYLPKDVYKRVFVDTEENLNNYCAYVGMTKKNGKKVDLQSKQCTQAEFYDFLRKNVISAINNPDVTKNIEEEITRETFLPKQVNKDNGVIPYQVHEYELKKILENMGKKMPFIRDNAEKILQLFTFRIPYYVGPLNNTCDTTTGKFAWSVRKNSEKIYPWNFTDVIDVEASAEKFIRRMTNKCTYLTGEDVLPKDSLLYSKFMVLNELNNLRLNGEKISVELKQKIYEDIFCKNRKVTQKKLKRYLVLEGIADKNVDITGIDGDFKASLTAYHDFKEKLADAELNQKDKETIILNIVLFGEDKKLLKQRVKTLFPKLTASQLKNICTLSYKGWGRLSKAFLENILAPSPETGEAWNIITALWETNDNLMQLLSREYGFADAIEEFNSTEKKVELSYDTVDELYVSPAVKRQVWQTFRLIKEIRKVMGHDPSRVFIEMAREKQESKRTESRKKQLIDLYRSCKGEEKDWIAEVNARSDQELRSDKLYLYYTQKGRCMYSGEVIDLEDLWDNTKYDIDHIYPQSKTMDDSLNNRVLVKKVYNSKKSDVYPLREDIRKKMSPFWKTLLDGGFISREKYARLVRNEELNANELAGFIERQIVETRQSTKAVANVLKVALPDTEIIYVKAGTVARFRQDFDLIKVREINDLHHAKDAYMNVVVGNAYYVKFTKNAAWFIKNNPGRSYNLKKLFEYDIERNGQTAWKTGTQGSIVTVKKFMQKNNILVTRKSYEVKGGLFDQQLMKKGKGQVPIKSSDARLCNIEKYGGYNKATGTYFMLVESVDKKGQKIRTIEYVPLYLKAQIEEKEESAVEYLCKERQLKNPRILLDNIKIDTLFDVDGFKMWLSGRTGNQLIFKCANQLVVSGKDEKILKKIIKYTQRKKDNKEARLSDRDALYEEDLLHIYDMFADKIRNTVYGKRLSAQLKTLIDKRDNFIKLNCEDKCCVLAEILHMFQCNSGSANLKQIGGPARAGILLLNNNITSCKNIFIINQSTAGIFENKVDLLKL